MLKFCKNRYHTPECPCIHLEVEKAERYLNVKAFTAQCALTFKYCELKKLPMLKLLRTISCALNRVIDGVAGIT